MHHVLIEPRHWERITMTYSGQIGIFAKLNRHIQTEQFVKKTESENSQAIKSYGHLSNTHSDQFREYNEYNVCITG